MKQYVVKYGTTGVSSFKLYTAEFPHGRLVLKEYANGTFCVMWREGRTFWLYEGSDFDTANAVFHEEYEELLATYTYLDA